MSDPPTRERDRRLFVNGEALRMNVEFPPSGGGDKYEPQTADAARDLLLPRLRSVVAEFARIPAELRGDKVYFEAQLLPNYLAPSHFPTALLARIGATAVGSRAAADVYRTRQRAVDVITRRLILAVDDDGLPALERLFEHPSSSRSDQLAFAEIRKLDDIGISSPEQVIVRRPEGTTGDSVWEAVLNPASATEGEPAAVSSATVEKWFALVEQFGGHAHRDYVRQVGGLTFAPVTLRADAVTDVARFNPLRVMRPMPPIRPLPGISMRSISTVQPPVVSDPLLSEPAIAVFDGGVDNHSASSLLFPVPDVDLTAEAREARYLRHGTGVVGATLYGIVNPGDQAGRPPLPVNSFRVLPAPNSGGLDEYWLLDEIKREVSAGDYRLVNLSLGPERAVEDSAEPDRWTAELDHLASERDVLFVVAAGNEGRRDRATGLHRVQVPGDMVNGLCVGACDAPEPDAPWERAPYSSMGPGRPGNRIQPSGVQFGGNDGRKFPVLAADGNIVESQGTSFATPVATHSLAGLVTLLPRPTASVLRAFAVHFSEKKQRHHDVCEVGYGRLPLSFDRFLDCDANEVHVLFEDEIDRGQLLGFRLPLPSEMKGPIGLTVTLAYASPVEASQPTEYTRVSLDLSLRPNQRMYGFTPPRGSGLKRRICDLRSAEGSALLQGGWTVSQEPVTKSLGTRARSPEIELREAGKWETVRQHIVRLAPEEFEEPRIEVTHVARRSGRLTHESEPVRFALLVTMRDRGGAGDLYDLVAAQFPALRPLARVPARIRVRTGSQ
jgi:hypothetical protein